MIHCLCPRVSWRGGIDDVCIVELVDRLSDTIIVRLIRYDNLCLMMKNRQQVFGKMGYLIRRFLKTGYDNRDGVHTLMIDNLTFDTR